tara:strand:- start:1363 stop:2010 length:648 start_codon:yes stop_codon:yes gene_type:complete
MATKSYQVTVEGVNPLICSNVQSSDPLKTESTFRAIFHTKRNKTLKDHQALQALDWIQSGYWDNQGQIDIDEDENTVEFKGFSDPILPGANFLRCLRQGAATGWKKGMDIKRGVVVTNNSPIDFKGSKKAVDLFKGNKYINRAFTKRGVWVSRLCFPDWKVTFNLLVNDEIVKKSDLKKYLSMAAVAEGLGTWRPRYGRFKTLEFKETTLQGAVN